MLVTRNPISIYTIIFLSIASILFFKDDSFHRIIVYFLIHFFLLYIIFCRYACKVIVDENRIEVRYLLFFESKDFQLNLDEIKTVRFEKGYYDIASESYVGGATGLFVFPIYCYDRLIIEKKDAKVDDVLYININTRMFQFDKMYKLLNSKIDEINKTKRN